MSVFFRGQQGVLYPVTELDHRGAGDSAETLVRFESGNDHWLLEWQLERHELANVRPTGGQ